MQTETFQEYQNGNYRVRIYGDGTKIRENDLDHFDAEFPEQIDCKITNYCDMGNICRYCHEASNLRGKHGDLDLLFEKVKVLPAGAELSLGGGSTLHHPAIISFLTKLRDIGINANITVNELHFEAQKELLDYLIAENLIKGLGISYRAVQQDHSALLERAQYKHAVIHVIAGVDTINDISDLAQKLPHKKILILGYKDFRKGKLYRRDHDSAINANIKAWYNMLPVFVAAVTRAGGVVSFDNLGIEQLNVRRLLTKEKWDEFFQGEDCRSYGSASLYIDAVDQKFARSSTDPRRFSYLTDAKEMFKFAKELENL